ncbi:hypothetical protein QJQ45_015258 [Haematococcus lacustris]|nr:hypothetical protein QJQ45_015258 [Haematococcus lacustris]
MTSLRVFDCNSCLICNEPSAAAPADCDQSWRGRMQSVIIAAAVYPWTDIHSAPGACQLPCAGASSFYSCAWCVAALTVAVVVVAVVAALTQRCFLDTGAIPQPQLSVPGTTRGQEASQQQVLRRLIKQSQSLDELHAILQQHTPEFDITHVSQALCRLALSVVQRQAWLVQGGMDRTQALTEAMAFPAMEILALLDPLTLSLAPYADCRAVGNALWAYSRMEHFNQRIFDTLCSQALRLQGQLRPGDCAQIMLAFGVFKRHHPDLLAAIPQIMLPSMYETRSEFIVQVLWGFARLGIPGTPSTVLMEAACDTLCYDIRLFKNQEIALLMWSLAKLQHTPSLHMLQLVERRMLGSLSRMGTQARRMRRFAPCAVMPESTSQGLARDIHGKVASHQEMTGTPQGPSPAANGVAPSGVSAVDAEGSGPSASLPVRWSGPAAPLATGGTELLSSLSAPRAWADALSITDSVNLVAGASWPTPQGPDYPPPPPTPTAPPPPRPPPLLHPPSQDSTPLPTRGYNSSSLGGQHGQQGGGGVGLSRPGLLQGRGLPGPLGMAASPAAGQVEWGRRDVAILVPQDIANLLWAFGRMRYKAATLLDELPLHLRYWKHAFTATDLCSVLCGYAHARHYHEGMLNTLSPLLASRLPSLELRELSTVLWAFGIFQHQPHSAPHLLDVMAEAVIAQLEHSKPQALAMIVKACANLRCCPHFNSKLTKPSINCYLPSHESPAAAPAACDHSWRSGSVIIAAAVYPWTDIYSAPGACQLPCAGASSFYSCAWCVAALTVAVVVVAVVAALTQRCFLDTGAIPQPQLSVPGTTRGQEASQQQVLRRLIKQSQSLDELHAILQQHTPEFDITHVSQALCRLALSVVQRQAWLVQGGMDRTQALTEAMAFPAMEILALLDPLTLSLAPYADCRAVGNALWAYSRMEHFNQRIFDTLCSQALRLQGQLRPGDCAQIMLAFGVFKRHHPDLLAAIPQIMLPSMYETRSEFIVQVLWGFARLGIPGTPSTVLMEAACDTLCYDIRLFKNQELALLMWSLAKLQHTPSLHMLQLVERRMLGSLSRMGTQARRMRSFAPRAVMPESTSQGLARDIHGKVATHQEMTGTPQGPSPAANGVAPSGVSAVDAEGSGPSASLPVRWSGPAAPLATGGTELLSSLSAPRAWADALSITDSVNLDSTPLPTRGYNSSSLGGQHGQQGGGGVGLSRPGLLQGRGLPGPLGMAASPAAGQVEWGRRDVAILVPQDIANLLWAFGRMRYKAATLLDELPLHLRYWKHAFTATDLCSVLCGYAHARHYHEGMLNTLSPLLASRLPSLELRELSTVLWAFGIFQHQPHSAPHLLDVMAEAVIAQLEHSKPQALAMIVKACANLRFRHPALLTHICSRAKAQLPEFSPHELSTLLYGLSHLAHTPLHTPSPPSPDPTLPLDPETQALPFPTVSYDGSQPSPAQPQPALAPAASPAGPGAAGPLPPSPLPSTVLSKLASTKHAVPGLGDSEVTAEAGPVAGAEVEAEAGAQGSMSAPGPDAQTVGQEPGAMPATPLPEGHLMGLGVAVPQAPVPPAGCQSAGSMPGCQLLGAFTSDAGATGHGEALAHVWANGAVIGDPQVQQAVQGSPALAVSQSDCADITEAAPPAELILDCEQSQQQYSDLCLQMQPGTAAASPITPSMALAAAPSPSLSPTVPFAAAASPSLSSSVPLSPEELQLFHGVLQRCILMLQALPAPGFEAGQRVNYTQQQSQYKVLNSVVFSCLRVGLAPWDLIDLAETKGLRLHQPSQPAPHQPTKIQAPPSQAHLATLHGATDQQQLQPDNQPLLQPQEQAEKDLDATSQVASDTDRAPSTVPATATDMDPLSAPASTAIQTIPGVLAAHQGRLISYTPPPAAAVTLPGKAVSGFTYQPHHDPTSLDRPPRWQRTGDPAEARFGPPQPSHPGAAQPQGQAGSHGLSWASSSSWGAGSSRGLATRQGGLAQHPQLSSGQTGDANAQGALSRQSQQQQQQQQQTSNLSQPASGSARPGASSSADQAGLRSPGPSLALGMGPLRLSETDLLPQSSWDEEQREAGPGVGGNSLGQQGSGSETAGAGAGGGTLLPRPVPRAPSSAQWVPGKRVVAPTLWELVPLSTPASSTSSSQHSPASPLNLGGDQQAAAADYATEPESSPCRGVEEEAVMLHVSCYAACYAATMLAVKGGYLSDWKKYDIKRCRVFVPIYTKEYHEGMKEMLMSPQGSSICNGAAEANTTSVAQEEEEGVIDDEEGVGESGNEDDDREKPDAEETAPTRSNPSLSSHCSSPSTPPSLSSRPSPAAAKLPTTSKDQKEKKTVPFFDMQPQGYGRELQLRSLAIQKKNKEDRYNEARVPELVSLMHFGNRSYARRKRPSLLPLLGQRNKQPNGNLSQASPSEEVGQLMKAAGSSSPNNKEASEPMLAERVAGGRLPGTEPLSPLGKAAWEEEDRYNEARGPKPGEPASDPREAGTAALTGTCPADPQPVAPLLAKPVVKAKPAVEVKVQSSAASSSAEKAGKAKDSPDPAPAQLMLSYKLVLHVRDGVKETGSKVQGGDGTVLRLQAALEAQGFSVFVGESDIEGGDSWTQAIQQAIDGCAVFIPVCSAQFGTNPGWTYREVLYALNELKAIIPVWHSSTYPPPDLKMMMLSFQRVPRGALPLVECDFDEVVTELVSCIRKKLALGGLL